MNTRDEVIDWLRDAYAMERGLETTLKKQSTNDKLSPDLQQYASMHLEETRRHAESVKAALESLGTDTSSLKTGLGVMTEATKGMATMFARDEQIKDLLTAYSMEHFEIACYTSLEAAAQQLGLSNVVAMCRQIIADEERMATTLLQAIPRMTVSYLSGVHAKAA